MAALRTQVADAIKHEIKPELLPYPGVVRCTHLPLYDLKDLRDNGLTLSVVPAAWEQNIETRYSTVKTLTVQIGVQKKLAAQDGDEIGTLDEFVEQLMDYFERRKLEKFPAALWRATRNEMMCYSEHLRSLVYTSVISLDYLIHGRA